MREAGGFDGAIGTYEKFMTYLAPLRDILSVPILLIGLEPPAGFKIRQVQIASSKRGYIEMIPPTTTSIVFAQPPETAVNVPVEPLIDEPMPPSIEE
jgi:hypothetical protein